MSTSIASFTFTAQLTQNFHQAAPASPTGEVAVLRVPYDGLIHILSVTETGNVVELYEDDEVDSGWSAKPLPSNGATFARVRFAFSSAGLLAVGMTTGGLVFSSSRDQYGSWSSWRSASIAHAPALDDFDLIVTDDSSVPVVLVGVPQTVTASTTWGFCTLTSGWAFGSWTDIAVSGVPAGRSMVKGAPCVVIQNSAHQPTCIGATGYPGQGIQNLDFASWQPSQQLGVSSGFAGFAATSVGSSAITTYCATSSATSGLTSVIGYDGSGQFWMWTRSGGTVRSLGRLLFPGAPSGGPLANPSLSRLDTVFDAQQDLHLFALDGDQHLVHAFRPNPVLATTFTVPLPIVGDVAHYAVEQVTNASPVVVTVGTDGTLRLHRFDPDAGTWSSEPVDLSEPLAVDEFDAYRTEIVVRDANGMPIPGAEVNLWATEDGFYLVGGSGTHLSAISPTRVTAGPGGRVAVDQRTSALYGGALLVADTTVDDPTEATLVAPNAPIAATLAALTPETLQDATNALTNAPLLSADYRDAAPGSPEAQTLADVVSAVTSSTELAVGEVMLVDGRAMHRVAHARVPEQSWRFTVDAGGARHEVLGHDAARRRMAAHAAAATGSWSGTSWGDVWTAVTQGLVADWDFVVATVGDAVSASVQFVIDGVSYAYSGVVSFVEDVFGLIQSVFSAIGLFFEDLLGWLEFVFSWTDILRTHTALSQLLTANLGVLYGLVDAVQGAVDGQIDGLQAAVTDVFQGAIADALGTASPAQLQEQNPLGDDSGGAGSNLLLAKLLDNAGSTELPDDGARGARATVDRTITDLLDTLTRYADGFAEAGDAYDSAVSYFESAVSASDQSGFLANTLAGLLSLCEAVVQFLLGGVQAVVDAIFDAVGALIQGIQAALAEVWTIPILTPLYAQITATHDNPDGDPLTVQDVLSLILAVPTTVVYKLVFGEAPFADDAALDAFVDGFTADNVLQRMGIPQPGGGQPQLRNAEDEALADAAWATAKLLSGSLSVPWAVIWSALEPVFDLQAVTVDLGSGKSQTYGAGGKVGSITGFGSGNLGLSRTSGAVYGWASVGFGLYAVVQELPFGIRGSLQAGGFDFTDPRDVGVVVYAARAAAPLADAASLIATGGPLRTVPKVGYTTSIIAGVGYLGLYIWLAKVQSDAAAASPGDFDYNPLETARNVVSIVPKISKFARIPKVVTSTEGISLAALAVTDMVCDLATAGMNVALLATSAADHD